MRPASDILRGNSFGKPHGIGRMCVCLLADGLVMSGARRVVLISAFNDVGLEFVWQLVQRGWPLKDVLAVVPYC